MAQIAAGQVAQVLTAQGTVNGVVSVIRTTGFVVGAKVSLSDGSHGIEARIVAVTNSTDLVLRDMALNAVHGGSDMSSFGIGSAILQSPQMVAEVYPILSPFSAQPATSQFPNTTLQVPAYSTNLSQNGSNGYVQVATPQSFVVGTDVTLTSTLPLSAAHLKITSIVNDKLYLTDTATGLPFNASAFVLTDTAAISQGAQYLFFNATYDGRSPPQNQYEISQLYAAIYPVGGGGAAVAFGNPAPASGSAIGARVVAAPPTYGAGTFQNFTLDTTGAMRVAGSFSAAGTKTPSDAFANPSDGSDVLGFLMGWTGSVWERVKTANSGRLQVDVVSGGGSNPSVGTTGAAVPASASYGGMNVGGNLVGLTGTGTSLNVTDPSPSPMVDRQATGAITNTQTVTLSTQGLGAVKLSITGTWTGTLTVEQTVDNVNWYTYGVFPLPTSRGLPLTGVFTDSTTSNGLYLCSGAGAMFVRVRGNVATGTANIAMDGGTNPSFLTANVIDDGVIVAGASTSALLGGGAVWNSTIIDMAAFTSASIYCFSDVSSAVNGIVSSWSTDGVTFHAESGASYVGGASAHRAITRRARYLRFSYTNGVSAQGAFSFQFIGQKVAVVNTTVSMDEALGPLDGGILTRSVITGLAPSGSYANVALSPTNALLMGGDSTPVTTATWTSATALASTVALSLNQGYGNTLVQVVFTGSITGGSLVFEGSTDNTNWAPITFASTSGGGAVSTVYFSGASGSSAYNAFTSGFKYVRARLATVVLGTGNVGVSLIGTLIGAGTSVSLNAPGGLLVYGAYTAADGFANPSSAGQSLAFGMGWNGTTWDRLRSTTANGLAVDVTRVQGTVGVTGTFWQATQPVSGTVAATQSGTWNIGTLTSITNPVAVTGTFWQATQPVSSTQLPAALGAQAVGSSFSVVPATASTWDVADRAARLLGVVYGSQAQQLKQTATNFNLAVESYVAGAAIDPRAIRALTNADVVTVQQTTGTSLHTVVDSGTITTITNPVSVIGATTLADAFANPTAAAQTGAFLMGFNGTTWDRVRTANTGRLQVDVVSGGGSNPSVSNTGAAVPAQATMVGGTDGTLLRALKTDATGQLYIANPGGAASVLMADTTANPTIPQTAGFLMGFNGTTWDRLRSTTANGLAVDVTRVTGNVAVTGTFWQTTQPISATQLPAALGAQAIAGSLSVTPATASLWDVSDRAARLLGVVYGSQAQQLKQTATNFNLAVETYVAGAAIDPRAIRALTNADIVTVQQTTGTSLHTVVDSGTITTVSAVTSITNPVSVIGASTAADTFANPTAAVLGLGFNMGWNGTTWDRLKSTTANGLQVDVTRVTGSVTVAQATGTNLHAVIDTGSTTAVTQATGTNLHMVVDSGTVTTVSTVTTVGTLTSITNAVSVIGATTAADAFANPTAMMQSGAFLMGFNGTTWDRVRTSNTGRLQVDVVTGGGSNASVGTTGSAVPASATMVGGTDGTLLRALKVDATGQLFIANPGGAASVLMADATANPTIPQTADFLMGFNGTTWDRVRVANTGRLQVDVVSGGGSNASVGTTGAAVPGSITYAGMNVGGNSVGLTGTGTALNINLASFGGTATTLGQKVMASSIPVTVASDQALTVFNGSVDAGNSSTANLGIGGVFTGTGFDAFNQTAVTVWVFANVSSAAGGVSLQFSTDNAAWDEVNTQTYTAGGLPLIIIAPVRGRYCRVVYTNGGVAQTTFRLQTIFKFNPSMGDILEVNDTIATNDHAQVMRAVLAAKTVAGTGINDLQQATLADAFTGPTAALSTGGFLMGYNGATWDRLRSSTANGLVVDVSRVTGNVTVAQATGTNLHAVIDTGSTTAVTQTTGTNLHMVVDSGTVTTVSTVTAVTSITNPVTVIGNKTAADTFANPADAQDIMGFLMGWNGTTWDRLRSTIANGLAVDVTRVTGSVTVAQATGTNLHAVLDTGSTTAVTQATGTNLHMVLDSGTLTSITNPVSVIGATTAADTFANPTAMVQAGSFLMGFNGTTWDRLRSTTANGLAVDVTRVTGTVTVGQATGTNLHMVVDSGTVTTVSTVTAVTSITNPVSVIGATTAADAFANPTAMVQAGAFNSVFNGTTWDRLRGSVAGGAWVQGPAAAGAAIAGNPVLMGGSDGTNARAVLTDTSGNVRTKEAQSPTGTVTSVASSATTVTLLASNTARRGATIYNESTAILYLKLGATASLTSYTLQVAGGGYYEVPFWYSGIIDGIWASANGNARVTEVT